MINTHTAASAQAQSVTTAPLGEAMPLHCCQFAIEFFVQDILVHHVSQSVTFEIPTLSHPWRAPGSTASRYRVRADMNAWGEVSFRTIIAESIGHNPAPGVGPARERLLLP